MEFEIMKLYAIGAYFSPLINPIIYSFRTLNGQKGGDVYGEGFESSLVKCKLNWKLIL